MPVLGNIDPPFLPYPLLVFFVIAMFTGLYGILPLAASTVAGGVICRRNPRATTRVGVAVGAGAATIAVLCSSGMLWLVINHSSHPLVKFLEQWQVLLVGWPVLMAFLSVGVTWLIVQRVRRQPQI